MITTCRPILNTILLLVFVCAGYGAIAVKRIQDSPKSAQSPTINYKERPRYPFDSQRLMRRPTLDGVIGENEWDALYTINDGPIKGTIYLNWDADNLYIAARTDQPGLLLFDLDANGDGWLRGADNLEIAVAPSGDAANPSALITARVLDAAGNRDTPSWNEKVVDPKSIRSAQKSTDGGWVVEIAIPKGIVGLSPRNGANLSVRGDLLPLTASATPTAAYEPHLLIDVSLVAARTTDAPGVSGRLILADDRLVPGQSIKATFELSNQTAEPLNIKSVSWQGEAAAVDIVSTLRDVNIPPIKGLKSYKHKFSSGLPETAIPGFYQLTAVATLENGRTVSSTTSFSVVDSFQLTLLTQPETIAINGLTSVKAVLEITSAVPGIVRGELEIEAPTSWDLKGAKKRNFVVQREDSTSKESFFLLVPSSTPAGDYPLKVTVTWRGKKWLAKRSVRVVNAGPPPTSTTEKKP